jgi:hypothetical protein
MDKRHYIGPHIDVLRNGGHEVGTAHSVTTSQEVPGDLGVSR